MALYLNGVTGGASRQGNKNGMRRSLEEGDILPRSWSHGSCWSRESNCTEAVRFEG